MNKLVYAISQAKILADSRRLDTLYLVIGKRAFRFVNGRYAGQYFNMAKQ